MRKLLLFLWMAGIVAVVTSCAQAMTAQIEQSHLEDTFVFVKGGSYAVNASNHEEKMVTVPDFYIDKYEVTQKQWKEIMGYNPSQFKGDQLPVEMVSWYEAIEYCNKRSVIEGLKPYYVIDKHTVDPYNVSPFDDVKWTVTIQEGADGYRLPTEAEWEYAANGGMMSHAYTYSGSDDPDEVAWYWRNSGDEYLDGDWNWPLLEMNNNRTREIGTKEPNELGIYDMSGNVREWVWDWYEEEEAEGAYFRVVKGGGWIGDVSNTAISFRGKFEANGVGPDQGFRVVRAGESHPE